MTVGMNFFEIIQDMFAVIGEFLWMWRYFFLIVLVLVVLGWGPFLLIWIIRKIMIKIRDVRSGKRIREQQKKEWESAAKKTKVPTKRYIPHIAACPLEGDVYDTGSRQRIKKGPVRPVEDEDEDVWKNETYFKDPNLMDFDRVPYEDPDNFDWATFEREIKDRFVDDYNHVPYMDEYDLH